MQQIAISVLFGSAVFFALMVGLDLLLRGATLNGETLMANVFKTVIFAMAYAAIKVGATIFKKDNLE